MSVEAGIKSCAFPPDGRELTPDALKVDKLRSESAWETMHESKGECLGDNTEEWM